MEQNRGGGGIKILKNGGQTRSRVGCLKKGGWNPLTNYDIDIYIERERNRWIDRCERIVKNCENCENCEDFDKNHLGSFSVSTPRFELHIWRLHEQSQFSMSIKAGCSFSTLPFCSSSKNYWLTLGPSFDIWHIFQLSSPCKAIIYWSNKSEWVECPRILDSK